MPVATIRPLPCVIPLAKRVRADTLPRLFILAYFGFLARKSRMRCSYSGIQETQCFLFGAEPRRDLGLDIFDEVLAYKRRPHLWQGSSSILAIAKIRACAWVWLGMTELAIQTAVGVTALAVLVFTIIALELHWFIVRRLEKHSAPVAPESNDKVSWSIMNWKRIPARTREELVLHLERELEKTADGKQALDTWIRQNLQGDVIGSDDPMFHFRLGRRVRDSLRTLLSDACLPPVVYNGKFVHDWDDFYYGALDQMLDTITKNHRAPRNDSCIRK